MAGESRSKVWSDVPASILAFVAILITFIAVDRLWAKVVLIVVLLLLTIVFLVLKRRENNAQEDALRRLQHSIDNLVRDLRARDKQLLQLQQQNRPRPLIIIEYDVHFEATPEHPFRLSNAGDLPALNISISPITFEQHKATFESVHTLNPGASAEVMPDLANQGLVFRTRLRILLDAAFQKTRWQPSFGLSRPEIEELFDKPVLFPLTVTYYDPTGKQYRGEFELEYIYFAARAFVRLRT